MTVLSGTTNARPSADWDEVRCSEVTWCPVIDARGTLAATLEDPESTEWCIISGDRVSSPDMVKSCDPRRLYLRRNSQVIHGEFSTRGAFRNDGFTVRLITNPDYYIKWKMSSRMSTSVRAQITGIDTNLCCPTQVYLPSCHISCTYT